MQEPGAEIIFQPLKIFVAGTRGVPDIPGGVEKHCQELYPRIAAMGHKIHIATRRPYVSIPRDEWKGIKLIHLYAPAAKSLEAIVHTLLAVIKARQVRADILHIHSVGPGLMVPLAKILGLRVVVTNHGPDYNRQKWNRAAQFMLKLGEYLSGCFADAVIAISPVIRQIIRQRCKREAFLIRNGVPLPPRDRKTDRLSRLGIRPGNYVFTAARFVPEKGIDLLIRAFQQLETDTRLVIAGDADHETEYSRRLKQIIDRDSTIIRTGYITGEALHQLYSHAKLFVLPSFHEGLPIALLEALSYESSVLVSDIPANREVNLPESRFFRCGSETDLAAKMSMFLKKDMLPHDKQRIHNMILNDYDWNKIAAQTLRVFQRTMAITTNTKAGI